MRKIGLLIIVFGLTLNGCKQNTKTTSETVNQEKSAALPEKSIPVDKVGDKIEVQKLIREVLNWAYSDNSIDLLPVTSGENDSIYSGFDKDKLKQNITKLTNSSLFSKEFIENYNMIILTLDKKLKNNDFEHEPWYVGDMPPFNFCSDVNPWCQCQDNMDWNIVEVEQIKGNDFQWKWGGLSKDSHQSWKDFRYKFSVIQEDSKLKISYLEGFNIDKIIK